MEIHGDKSPHRLTEMKSRTVVARNWGAGGGAVENVELTVTGREFQLGRMRKFWK